MKQSPLVDLVNLIQSHLCEKSYEKLKGTLSDFSVSEMAKAWSGLSSFQKIILFRLMALEVALALFRELQNREQWLLIQTLQPGALGPIIDELGPFKARELFWTPDEKLLMQLTQIFRTC